MNEFYYNEDFLKFYSIQMKHDSLNQIMALSYACNTMILQSENRLLVLWLGMINLLYILIE